MELRHLRYFIEVAERLSFSRAADYLCMTEPPLSQQIRLLEDELGAKLLVRTSRHVQLTEAGESFLEDVRAILARVDHAARRARLLSQGITSQLNVGFCSGMIYGLVPDVLSRFREEYPNVEVKLLELSSLQQGQELREKRIDVGFARSFCGQSRSVCDEQEIAFEPLGSEPMAAALPASHPLALRAPFHLAELAEEPFVIYPRDRDCDQCFFTERWHGICAIGGFRPHITQVAGEVQTALSMVAAGFGVTLVPASMCKSSRDGIVYSPLTDPAPALESAVMYRQEDQSQVLPYFLDIVRETARGQTPSSSV